LKNARRLCELFREQIAENPVLLSSSGYSCPITISVGAAELIEEITSLSNLLSAADRALYCAKEMGRNRVSTYSDGDFQQRRQRELFPD
jgi:diguanylate cyclase (GGDEF)-like protein